MCKYDRRHVILLQVMEHAKKKNISESQIIHRGVHTPDDDLLLGRNMSST